MKKAHILSEIKRTAAKNGGIPLGIDRFREATGIRKEDWYGVFWAKWTDAQIEAGCEPNQFGTPALEEEWMLTKIADCTRELGYIPIKPELMLRKKNVPDFPNIGTIRRRLGSKSEMVDLLIKYCRIYDGWTDVIDICLSIQESLPTKDQSGSSANDSASEIGHVYLLKHDKVYKIGRSTDASRRYKEIRAQMPYETEEIHVIETDDPAGIEAYWHNRFRDKRLKGEWFELSVSDVKVFKKRKFM
jgi:hypothetical protein